MPGSVDRMVELVEWYCASANLGYDQWNRWDFPAVGDTQYAGECDCSSLVYHCAELAGFDVPKTGTRYTGTMMRDFTRAGFKWIQTSSTDWMPGDILYKDGHTAIWTGKYIAEAYSDERGGDHGGRDGDQGNETRLSPKRGGGKGFFRWPEPPKPIIWPKEVEPMPAGEAMDYIIEEGSNNVAHLDDQQEYFYRYEKWASGKLVCYISDYFNPGTGKSFGGAYYIDKTMEFPEMHGGPKFIEPPVMAGCTVRSKTGWVSIQRVTIYKNKAPFWAFGSKKAIPRFSVDMTLVGCWK